MTSPITAKPRVETNSVPNKATCGSSERVCRTIGPPLTARTAIRLTRPPANSSTCSASRMTAPAIVKKVRKAAENSWLEVTIYEGRKHYFLVSFPQEPGALRRFLDDVLGQNDDITYFEYVKRSDRETGPALVAALACMEWDERRPGAFGQDILLFSNENRNRFPWSWQELVASQYLHDRELASRWRVNATPRARPTPPPWRA